jgi:hypothetical protein
MKLRRPGAWLYPALLCGALLLQTITGCGTGSSGSSAGSLSAEEQIKEAMETAERARETAVAWIKAEPTMAQYSNLRWVSAGRGGPRGMVALDLLGDEPVRPWFSGPPWVLAEGTFYFQDPAKAAGSDERSWYKLTPTGVLHLAESAKASEREQILAVLDHVRFMLWADPLWVIENMEITEAGGLLQDAGGVIGSSFAGRLPNPDTYAPELEAARTLSEGSSDTWQTPDLYGPTPGAAGATSASLEVDREGRPTLLQFKGPDGLVWDWEFARTSEEVSAPSGAADWLPSGP